MDRNTTLSLFPELDRDISSFNRAGIFPSQKIRDFIKKGYITANKPNISPNQIQPASLDLRLGKVAYQVRASFLPGAHSEVKSKIQGLKIKEIDLTKSAVFDKGNVYIVPLIEELDLRPGLSAKANPKSTTGRLDIFARLITDQGVEFERVPEAYKGKLYCEVAPRTFPIRLKSGMRLNQLRFIQAKPSFDLSDPHLSKLDASERLVYLDDEDKPSEANINEGLRISVNLRGKPQSEIIGYRARKNSPVIDLQKKNHYSPEDFWEAIKAPKTGSIILNPDDFYILSSKEKVRIPPSFAAELVAYDPTIGEFRIHYAGFFDPGFGYGSSNIKGTHAVLEVRSHEVPFVIEDGQMVGRLIYEPLLEIPDKLYGIDIGSSYQSQGLALSKQFKNLKTPVS